MSGLGRDAPDAAESSIRPDVWTAPPPAICLDVAHVLRSGFGSDCTTANPGSGNTIDIGDYGASDRLAGQLAELTLIRTSGTSRMIEGDGKPTRRRLGDTAAAARSRPSTGPTAQSPRRPPCWPTHPARWLSAESRSACRAAVRRTRYAENAGPMFGGLAGGTSSTPCRDHQVDGWD